MAQGSVGSHSKIARSAAAFFARDFLGSIKYQLNIIISLSISTSIMRCKIITTLVLLCLSACSTVFPDPCQVGVPTNKNCFTVQGNKGAWGFGPINIVNSRF